MPTQEQNRERDVITLYKLVDKLVGEDLFLIARSQGLTNNGSGKRPKTPIAAKGLIKEFEFEFE